MTQALTAPHPVTLARASDPATSHEAAARVDAFGVRHQAAILGAMSPWSARGAEEIAAACGLQAYQVRKRLPELQRRKLVIVTDDERPTSSGRHERLWLRSGAGG